MIWGNHKLLSNPLDSQKTKLLKTKTADFSIKTNSLSQIVSKKPKFQLLLLRNPKNNNIILVISISLIQRKEHFFLKDM